MNMQKYVFIALTVLGITTTSAVAADDHPPTSLFESASGQETQRIEASKGNAERRGDELVIWINGYAPKERGMIFRNWSQGPGQNNDTDGNSFIYYGYASNYHIVREDFTHDSQILYIIDVFGRINKFHMGDDTPYMTQTGRHIVSLRATSASRTPLVNILGWHQARRKLIGFEGELTCNQENNSGADDSITPIIVSISDDDITVQLDAKKGSLGTMKLARDGWQWKVVEPETLWPGVTCR
jgi:hypothetical protein